MFNLFASKNQKLVKKWQDEHSEIVDLAHKVLAEYSKYNPQAAKKHLKALNDLTVDHVMDEDIELFNIVREDENIDPETEEMIHNFVQSFKKTKLALMEFLGHYSKPEVTLDEKFFEQFNDIVDAIGERIQFEEKNVYSKLKEK